MTTESLSFPRLGLQFDLDRVAFTVAGRPIYWYGIIIAVAFLLGAAYILKRSKTFGLDGDRVMDVVLGGVLLGIVGARLYYVAFRWDTYGANPITVFDIREGGLAIYGGIIGGVLAAVLICRWRRVKLLPMLDLATGGLLLGQAIGRWGNFVNIEAFGRNTALPWGMISPTTTWYLNQNRAALQHLGVTVDPSQPVHPTFLYESLWCLLGFLFILWFTKRRRFDGELGLIYLGWYGLGRFFIEGLRTDSLLMGTVRVSQMLALLCVIAAALGLVIMLSKIKRANDPDYLMLYVNTDEGKEVVSGEYYKKLDEEKKLKKAAVKKEAEKPKGQSKAVETSGDESEEQVAAQNREEDLAEIEEIEAQEQEAKTDGEDN